ncbi:4-alpha-glucanotransferase [Mariprofundus micogutta]|uniref:4-alpha-glucanotransferase n=1 Tax=Mariprofundus micogutta TaxID=1921010 RepID=A0A1L8CNR6_9PROT|nr:4-alpha-glucanotransferase [Mariprofundus micogutta]GAV20547.1 4-alpha-glucanotransferase [Mariprofundus micogutta]
MNAWLDHRSSAALLHITSLPGPFHKGVLGAEARSFIQHLHDSGFRIWQFLPLGPTHGHGSPYESLSSFAGNPELIDLRECVQHGWLSEDDLSRCDTAQLHEALRYKAGKQFWAQVEQQAEIAQKVDNFSNTNSYWLDDYALFFALKNAFRDRAWWQWPQELRDRKKKALKLAKTEHIKQIRQAIFEQYLFDCQWQSLKRHAEAHGIQLFGDLPIYVAHDSADVWANREYFTVNKYGLCDEVAGVPPDYFSETGQRWGNPLYLWDKLQADDFSWWVQRVKRQLDRMHMLRIDHFRALEAFWVIPGESEDGIIGEWREAPGDALLQTLNDKLGKLPLIAEDLGIITDEVTALREKFELPGMKILLFAFGGDESNPYLPENHEENSVVYTGTHDNDTTLGWFDQADEHVRKHALTVLGAEEEDMPWAMIECAMASVARMAVIPMQDLLELGTEAKFNTPGTLENNWCWRMSFMPEAGSLCWTQSKKLNVKYGRCD